MTLSSKSRALFILKYRANGPYGTWSYPPDASGGTPAKLANGLNISALQVVGMLNSVGIAAGQVHVVDNNDIDREVTAFKPTHVFIEAFWVVPEKFDILKKLHPGVTWIVRNHSKMDFLAAEGGAIGWGLDYIKKGVTLACNSEEATRDFKALAVSVGADPAKVICLPNFYNLPTRSTMSASRLWSARMNRSWEFNPVFRKPLLSVGCFGAIRPLKNTLDQAVGAILAADVLRVPLAFVINGNRIEGGANSMHNAVKTLFAHHPKHQLVELGWMEHDKFLDAVSSVDMVSQVSSSETFNIVAADAVHQKVPVVGSAELPWLGKEFCANPGDVTDIRDKIVKVAHYMSTGAIQDEQYLTLQDYVQASQRAWILYFAQH